MSHNKEMLSQVAEMGSIVDNFVDANLEHRQEIWEALNKSAEVIKSQNKRIEYLESRMKVLIPWMGVTIGWLIADLLQRWL